MLSGGTEYVIRPYTVEQHVLNSGARWPSSRPLSRNALKVGCPWKLVAVKVAVSHAVKDQGLRHPSNSRDVGNRKDPSSNRNASFKQGHQQEKSQPQQQKRQQQQNLCEKA